jgi:hypothetical protein
MANLVKRLWILYYDGYKYFWIQVFCAWISGIVSCCIFIYEFVNSSSLLPEFLVNYLEFIL